MLSNTNILDLTYILKVSVLFLGFIISILMLIFIKYIIIYTYRSITMSIISFLWFFVGFITFIFLGVSALFIMLRKVPSIFLEDLSIFSYYKYVILLIICSIGFIILAMFKYTNTSKHSTFRDFLFFPYMKEEFRTILYTWNNAFMGNICIRLLDFITRKSNRLIYFVLHYAMFIIITLIQNLLFINFVFFHGNLKYVLYFLPISFFVWCLGFIEYYFNTFITQSGNYIRAVLSVKVVSSIEETPNHANIIVCNISDLRCKLTTYGIQEGFTEHDLSYLANKWLQLNHITIAVENYLKILNYSKYLNFALRILCWSGIIYNFISPTNVYLSPISAVLGRAYGYRAFHSSRVLRAQEARWIKPQHRADFEKTFPGLKGNHPIVVDPALQDENGYVPLYTQGSHGLANNQSKEINPNKDFQGYSRPQNGVFPNETTSVKESWTVKPAIPGSAQMLQEPKSKENMAKHTTYVEHDDDYLG